MADFGTLVVDGALGSAEQIRRLTWLASGGDWGLATPDSLKVTATSPPSARVQVSVGSAVLRNGSAYDSKPFPDASPAQSYLVTAPLPLSVPVPPNTGATPVTRYVTVTARDPQYAGMGQVDQTRQDDYVDVAAGLAVPTDRPSLVLATIVVPPNTGTITDAMITRQARILNPRSQRSIDLWSPSGPIRGLDAYGPDANGLEMWRTFPFYAHGFTVPSWASKAIVISHLDGVVFAGQTGGYKGTYPPTGSTVIPEIGFRIKLGGLVSETVPFAAPGGPVGEWHSHTVDSDRTVRQASWTTTAQFDVTSLRGAATRVSLDCRSKGAAPNVNPWYVDQNTTLVFDVTFQE